ncbi:leucine-rich repeat-containing protein 27-like isoform X2 [Cylas formicarius]|uniref:leucine-rich repeat-containing protein 27-like isoform X2 n=1 Tax=Cylas formicarius TaxID=197179 RepID=UPI002958D0C4|nr:leucine-rich repeat-containing protein 27-like isoform X2 [Cylas formicarius]
MSSHHKIIADRSRSTLKEVPKEVLEMSNLKMLFLEGNLLTKLPDDFFHCLPNIVWLDLRNNMLECLPRSVKNHRYLENLLLSNNNIQKLPNELGLVPNLKALQLADNPLIYPAKRIIQEGTRAVKKYLREQYDINSHKSPPNNSKSVSLEEREERVLKVVDEFSNASMDKSRLSVARGQSNQSRESTKFSQKKNLSKLAKKLSDPKLLTPTLRVKKLDYPRRKKEEPLKIVHRINKSETKISLKSYFTKSGIRDALERIPEKTLKEGWLNKLRILLNDQERILQQERNLRALSSWRYQTKNETPKTFYDKRSDSKPEPPYAVYPEYSKIPSRAELTSQLQLFLKNTHQTHSKSSSAIDMDKLINDLVEQLKEMEMTVGDKTSPNSELEQTSQQIRTITEIHNKLLKLRSANCYT